MTIGELARAGNVKASLVRYYESLGVLPEPRRVGNARRYGADSLARLNVILVARRLGLSLSEIREIALDPTALKTIAARRVAEIAAVIREARVQRALLHHASAHGRFAADRYTSILARLA
jgi:DNA-binding transcriptional MerR regulator